MACYKKVIDVLILSDSIDSEDEFLEPRGKTQDWIKRCNKKSHNMVKEFKMEDLRGLVKMICYNDENEC